MTVTLQDLESRQTELAALIKKFKDEQPVATTGKRQAPTADQMRAYASSALAALEGVEPVQVWCDTCEGTGVVHQESEHGVPGSGGDFQCPDCDGRGFNERSYYTTPPAAPSDCAEAIRALLPTEKV